MVELSRVVAFALAIALTAFAQSSVRKPDDAKFFDQHIAPLLARRCLDCHAGPGGKRGLDLQSKQGALKGGKSGKVIIPGKPDESLLWDHVDQGHMPPKKPLPPEEKKLLKEWIARGAPWGTDPIDPFRFTTARRAGYDWWALQPVQQPSLPAVRDKHWPHNAIDHFILAQLEAKGLKPSPAADRRTLIRRLSFDLIGLPPTPEEVESFVKDIAANAYAKLVDRLLASPHYGERWARHWLDVVRFGESHGFEHDELRKNAWPYRDWVINAFNRDLPYDEFARLQIAGDVVKPGDPDAVAATGFLVAGPYDTVGQVQQSVAMKAVVRQDELEDMVGTLGQTFLGLTVHCARCHDHKFDPIRQIEYYRLTAALAGVRHGERDVPSAAAVKEATAKKSGPKVYAVNPKPPEAAHLLIRGNPGQKGPAVTAGGVASLSGATPEFGLPENAADADRRRKLAAWVADRKNPLFARAIVNRLWHYHFGQGLVETPNDFGFNGGRPSHRELLDWLAAELWRQGGSLKAMHKLIVTSATYQQASIFRVEAAKLDAGNRLLWRKSPTRLEAEAVRDAILSVSGRLNPAPGGPGYHDFKLTIRGSTHYYDPYDADDPAIERRSVYRTWARSGRSGLLDTLDCPDPSTTTPKRAVTTTPLQALTLLNNAFVLRQADHFAKRLARESKDTDQQITRAYHLAFARRPELEEITAARAIVGRHGLATLCRAIFNSNEYVFVD